MGRIILRESARELEFTIPTRNWKNSQFWRIIQWVFKEDVANLLGCLAYVTVQGRAVQVREPAILHLRDLKEPLQKEAVFTAGISSASVQVTRSLIAGSITSRFCIEVTSTLVQTSLSRHIYVLSRSVHGIKRHEDERVILSPFKATSAAVLCSISLFAFLTCLRVCMN